MIITLDDFEMADATHTRFEDRNGQRWLIVGQIAPLLQLPIAPDGYSGACCSSCGRFFKVGSLQEPKMYREACDDCGELAPHPIQPITGIQSRDVELVTDPAKITSRDWWHLSYKREWPSDPDEPVHIGSLETAISRMANMQGPKDIEGAESQVAYRLYLHRVRLDDVTELFRFVSHDNNLIQPLAIHASKIQNCSHYDMSGVNRYINTQENNGSISLFLHPKWLTVIDTLEFPIYKAFLRND